MLKKILSAIKSADDEGLLNEDDKSILTGYSGTKLVGCLQRLANLWESMEDACYLEVGVFQGLTLLSVAAANPQLPCYGIDNFAFFDPEGKNHGLVLERRAKLNANNARIINLDYEDALETLGNHIPDRKVAIYFVDGPHDYRSQLMCLELALPYLRDDAVIIIDDCNYNDVRQANRDFLITHPDFALVFEAYTPCHPFNMNEQQTAEARSGWWNGVNILVRDPKCAIERSYPPTERNRTLFENDRILHSSKIAEHAVHALRVASALDKYDLLEFGKAMVKLWKEMNRTRKSREDLFSSMNTFTSDLPKSRYGKLN